MPDEQGGHYTITHIPDKEERWKRPAFDIGMFEVPNMLGFAGREPGTIGARHFLELPCADAFRRPCSEHHDRGSGGQSFKHFADLSATDAMKAVKSADEAAAVGKHSKVYNRAELVKGGPSEWKKIGIRDVSKKTIIDRLSHLQRVHDEVVAKGSKATVLNHESPNELYSDLFNKLLYLPPKPTDMSDPYSLKNQIEALVKILATRGAWVDFSLVEWRIRLGQIIWELPTHSNDPAEVTAEKEATLRYHAERKWLFLQILLSCELMARLDAAIRIGIVQHSDKLPVSASEIHHFNHLRSQKVDWDLVLARRFFDYTKIQSVSAPFSADLSVSDQEKHLTSWIRDRLMNERKNKLGNQRNPDHDHGDTSAECFLLPRRGKQQIDGLVRFAQGIGWPRVDEFERAISIKLAQPPTTPDESIYSTPLHSPTKHHGNSGSYFDSFPTGPNKQQRGLRRATQLKAAPNGTGGWLSRSWLTGMVLPGEAASHILISSLLEHDPQVLASIGESAALCGGFVYNRRSWWSKQCIVGRVIAALDGTNESMGWIGTQVLPVDGQGHALDEGWIEVETNEVPNQREKPRIHDGSKISIDSSPMGVGEGTIHGKEFVLPVEKPCDQQLANNISFKNLIIHEPPSSEANAFPSASTTFTTDFSGLPEITFDLKHDVYFITAFPCKPPPGHTLRPTVPGGPSPLTHRVSGFEQHAKTPTHKHPCVSSTHYPVEHLPAHPLHKSYNYVTKSLADLLSDEIPARESKDETTTRFVVPWVVDARGSDSKEKEAFVRSRCAQVGLHCLVARVGRSCLGCCVREARALDVGIVVRVGEQAEKVVVAGGDNGVREEPEAMGEVEA